jgi:hypothetical protein
MLGGLGVACANDATCASGHCADGVCCNTSCGGRCEACVQAKTASPSGSCHPVPAGMDPDNECPTDDPATCGSDGTCDGTGSCRRYPVGSSCAPARCEGNSFLNAGRCTNAGTCASGTALPCGLFRCGDNGCPQSCASQGDCLDSAYCGGGGCQQKKAAGQPCSNDDECLNGNCLRVPPLLNLICSIL